MLQRLFAFLLISLCFCSLPALAYTVNDIEWKDSATSSATLAWGDTLTMDSYVIKAGDFSKEGVVSISISRNGRTEKIQALRNGETMMFRDVDNGDDVMVTISGMNVEVDPWTGNMKDPKASVNVYKRAYPEMSIEINTDKDTYDPRSMNSPSITATLKIKNSGDAKAFIMDANIEASGLELTDGNLRHRFENIDEDAVLDPIVVKFKVPHFWEQKKIDIKVTTNSKDINGQIHTHTKVKTITIEPVVELVVTKYASPNIYIDKYAHVSVSVYNNGIYRVNDITVTDTLNDLFRSDCSDQQETISLSPGETKADLFKYTLKPINAGKIKIPEATASFIDNEGKMHTFNSPTPEISVDGPNILLTKSLEPASIVPGGHSTVSISIKNQGNKKAGVTISESLPSGVSHISGSMEFQEVIDGGHERVFSYVISTDQTNEIELPASCAKFTDLESYRGERTSNSVVLKIAEPGSSSSDTTSPDNTNDKQQEQSGNNGQSSGATATPDDTRVQPGFEASLMLFVLGCVFFVIRSKRKQ